MGNLLKVLSIKRTFSSSHGFTLIELLVAMGIIGIITTGLLIAVNPVEQLRKSRDAKRVDALNQIKTALELYYQDYGRYPPRSIGTTYQIVDASNPGTPISWGGTWSPYMQTVPTDPGGKPFRYWVDESTNGQGYAIYASLDRAELACGGVQTQPCGAAASRVGSPTGAGAYNYGISSGNVSP